jgi:hypothetical protein
MPASYYIHPLLLVPRPPGNRHYAGGFTQEWYWEGITVCNCAEHCRPINTLVHERRITLEQWRAWHAEPITDPDDYLHTDTEDEDSMNTKKTFICAACHSTLSLSYRQVGKLESPSIWNGASLDRLCKSCADRRHYFVRFNMDNPSGELPASQHGRVRRLRWIPTATAIMLVDISEYVSPAFATRHCNQVSNGRWFREAAAAHNYEIRIRRETQNNLAAYRQQSSAGAHIFGYHEVNNILLFGWPEITPRDSFCFGVELEMENAKDSSIVGGMKLSAALNGRLDDPKNRYVLARDGSLNASGIELITRPYTLDYHQHTFDWKEVLRPAIAAGGCAGKHTTNCGMHVHVNRAAISPLTLGKALIFVNADKNRALIERIAQRASNSYTNLRPKKLADGRMQSTAKYEAMHLSTETIEFRIFRGNLRFDRVLKNIEFCHSVIRYVETIGARDCTQYEPYLKFIVENGKLYPHLLAFLREKDTIAIRKGSKQIQIVEEI